MLAPWPHTLQVQAQRDNGHATTRLTCWRCNALEVQRRPARNCAHGHCSIPDIAHCAGQLHATARKTFETNLRCRHTQKLLCTQGQLAKSIMGSGAWGILVCCTICAGCHSENRVPLNRSPCFVARTYPIGCSHRQSGWRRIFDQTRNQATQCYPRGAAAAQQPAGALEHSALLQKGVCVHALHTAHHHVSQ